MPSDRQLYTRALNAVALRYGRMENDTVRRIWALLRQVQGEIAADLTSAEGFRAYQLREVLESVDRYLAAFDAQAIAELRGGIAGAYQFGGAYVVDPLTAVGLDAGFNQLTPQILNVIVDASADLVTGISEPIRRFLNLQIRQVALQQLTPIEAMRNISQHFGFVSMRPGRETVKGIAYNAERIVRTELSRNFNLATHSQQLATAERVPELRKKWIATGDARTRQTHLAAHMRYMDNPIPVSEPFEVGGELLMYPLDPNGSPGNVIHCRCRSISVHPLVGVLPLKTDDRIRSELERRKEALVWAMGLLRQRVTPETQLGVRMLEARVSEIEAAVRVAA